MADKIATIDDIASHIHKPDTVGRNRCVTPTILHDYVLQGETYSIEGSYANNRLVPLSKISFDSESNLAQIRISNSENSDVTASIDVYCGNTKIGSHNFISGRGEIYVVKYSTDSLVQNGITIRCDSSSDNRRVLDFTLWVNGDIGFRLGNFECQNQPDGSFDPKKDPSIALLWGQERLDQFIRFGLPVSGYSYSGSFSFTLESRKYTVNLETK